ncbi:hypothetical protein H0H93_010139 [Arthromyces matolae]|nr:hypothetical protein H0H93_010139 [Arthromyces matolae]
MFATCDSDIAMGDSGETGLFAERPILVMLRKMMMLNVDPDAVSLDEISDAQTVQMHIDQSERLLEGRFWGESGLMGSLLSLERKTRPKITGSFHFIPRFRPSR